MLGEGEGIAKEQFLKARYLEGQHGIIPLFTVCSSEINMTDYKYLISRKGLILFSRVLLVLPDLNPPTKSPIAAKMPTKSFTVAKMPAIKLLSCVLTLGSSMCWVIGSLLRWLIDKG